jgi:chromosome segregation ATPase
MPAQVCPPPPTNAPSHPSTQKLQAANNLALGKLRLALSLIRYPDEVANTMAFVFGDTLIYDDAVRETRHILAACGRRALGHARGGLGRDPCRQLEEL